jgi:putative colanic acid biosynthesis acetyltransferase WcaF
VSPVPHPDARHVSASSTREKIKRMLWAIAQGTLFRLSFHTWYGFRAWLLRRFGATIGWNVRIRRTVVVECPWNLTIGDGSSVGHAAILYCLGPVRVGRHVSISQYAHVCAGSHDYRRPDMPLLRPTITVGDDAWIAADAFVGPGVTVGAGAILGARGVALRDLLPMTIYVGNPAQRLRARPPIEGAPGGPNGPTARVASA